MLSDDAFGLNSEGFSKEVSKIEANKLPSLKDQVFGPLNDLADSWRKKEVILPEKDGKT